MSDANSPIVLLERAVLAGGRAILELLASGGAVESTRKADNSLVLNLDLASQAAMHAVLKGAGTVVSEEDPASHAMITPGGSYWVVDPLDGTSSCRRSLVAYGKFVPGQVGFGPVAGYVENGRMVAGAFFNLPDRMLYTAVQGQGAFVLECGQRLESLSGAARCRIQARQQSSLLDAAVLFYPGSNAEFDLIYYLKVNRLVDAVYRFGSFANDCARVACGYEQIKTQFGPRAWDLPAALLAAEAGCTAIIDPLGTALALAEWDVALRNSVCIVAPGLETEMREVLRRFKSSPQAAQHAK